MLLVSGATPSHGPPSPSCIGVGGGGERVYNLFIMYQRHILHTSLANPPPQTALSTEKFRNQQGYEKCVRYASGT